MSSKRSGKTWMFPMFAELAKIGEAGMDILVASRVMLDTTRAAWGLKQRARIESPRQTYTRPLTEVKAKWNEHAMAQSSFIRTREKRRG
jgi:hypothetical protein